MIAKVTAPNPSEHNKLSSCFEFEISDQLLIGDNRSSLIVIWKKDFSERKKEKNKMNKMKQELHVG
jgi:hypothetical protein